MKKFIYLFSIIAMLTACDKVEQPYLDRNVVGSEIVLAVLSQEDATAGPVTKEILLEDFTGFKCTGCPAAHIIAEEIREDHPEQVHVIAVHCTSTFAAPDAGAVFPDPFSQDFRTEAGENYAAPPFGPFGINLLPTGLINRTLYGDFLTLNPNTWAETIEEIVDEESNIELKINAASFSNDSVNVEISLEFLNDLEGEYYFTIALVENEIISSQVNVPDENNYLQKDVLRGNLNGIWGELIKADPRQRDIAYVLGKYPLPGNSSNPTVPNPEIEIDDCHLIVYVYKSDFDAGIYDIQQVKKKTIGF